MLSLTVGPMKKLAPLAFVIAIFALLAGGVLIGESIHVGAGKWLGVTAVATVFAVIRWRDYGFRKLPIAVHIAGATILLAMIGRTVYLLIP